MPPPWFLPDLPLAMRQIAWTDYLLARITAVGLPIGFIFLGILLWLLP